MRSTTQQRHFPTRHDVLTQATKCLEAEPDSACLLSDDWEFLYVNPAWERFAEKNGGLRSRALHLIGRSYFSFSGDKTTEQLLRSIQVRVSSGEAFTLFTNCDSPGVARRLASHFVPVSAGGFQGSAVLHLTMERGAWDLPWGDASGPLPRDQRCSCCHRVLRGGHREWHLEERAKAPLVELSSTSCPTCEGLQQWSGKLVARGVSH